METSITNANETTRTSRAKKRRFIETSEETTDPDATKRNGAIEPNATATTTTNIGTPPPRQSDAAAGTNGLGRHCPPTAVARLPAAGRWVFEAPPVFRSRLAPARRQRPNDHQQPKQTQLRTHFAASREFGYAGRTGTGAALFGWPGPTASRSRKHSAEEARSGPSRTHVARVVPNRPARSVQTAEPRRRRQRRAFCSDAGLDVGAKPHHGPPPIHLERYSVRPKAASKAHTHIHTGLGVVVVGVDRDRRRAVMRPARSVPAGLALQCQWWVRLGPLLAASAGCFLLLLAVGPYPPVGDTCLALGTLRFPLRALTVTRGWHFPFVTRGWHCNRHVTTVCVASENVVYFIVGWR